MITIMNIFDIIVQHSIFMVQWLSRWTTTPVEMHAAPRQQHYVARQSVWYQPPGEQQLPGGQQPPGRQHPPDRQPDPPHDVFIGGLSSDTSEDYVRAHLMDLQVKHIVSIVKLTTNVPRVVAFRVTIADDTIEHNVFNPINFQQGIQIIPFRYYEKVKTPDLAPPALKQPTTTKTCNVIKPARNMKPRMTKDNNNQENSASKTTQGNHHKQNDSTLQQAQECPKEPDSSHTAYTRPSYGLPLRDHPCKWLTLCNHLHINNLTTDAPCGSPQWH